MNKKIKEKIKRISIVGGAGSGKTTLADNLGKQLNLPVVHIDGINYFANWEERNKAERDKIIIEKANEDKWVIEGTYRSTLEYRMQRADLIIFLRYSTFSLLKGTLSRWIKNKGKEKTEIPRL